MRGGAEDANPTVGVFDDREHVQASAGQRVGLEEVAGQQRAGLRAEEC